MKKIFLLILLAASMSFALKVVGQRYSGNKIVGNMNEVMPSFDEPFGTTYFRLDNSGGSEIKGFKIYYYINNYIRQTNYTYKNKFFVEGSRGLAADAKISWEYMPESPYWTRVVFDYPTRVIPAGGVHPTDDYYMMFEFILKEQRIHGKYYGIIKKNFSEIELRNIVVESADGKILYGKHPENNTRIGVLAAKTGCYSGFNIDMLLDEEDKNSQTRLSNSSDNFSGVKLEKKNVKFWYCGIEVNEMPKTKFDYFVLKLDANCPKGAYPFRRYHDTEDNNNVNSMSGNVRGWPNDLEKNATLEYCFVPGDSKANLIFPFSNYFSPLDIGYAVFANFATSELGYLGLQTQGHELYMDDEDSNNKNSWYWYDTPSSIQMKIKKIAYGSTNTTYNILSYQPMSAAMRRVTADVNQESVAKPASVVKPSAMVKAADRSVVRVELPAAGDVEVSFVKPSGGVVATLAKDNLQPGVHTLNWNSQNVPDGRYIVTIKHNGSISAANVILK